ncbi:DNA modification methylase [Microbacterium sp. NEAU-LLC]|uniref:DNA modification methylase n=1 Tax=Microbacterium helvum TaxID=2773713 RepID=A0ABR8NRN3_9MICO|nr:DNA modification methylase [Microbacterium helvum]MBD3942824.1 DNA modification methylase [Microbacterium helvum]
MNRRLIASLAVGAALVLTTTGCSMISPQATTIPYSAAEGTNVHDSGPLEVRNAFVVANDEGTAGNFVAAIVNDTEDSHTLNVEFGEGGPSLTVRVPANTTVSLGSDEDEPLEIDGFEGLPGTDVATFFQSGDSEGALVSIPVLDGSLDYLSALAP